MSRKPIHPCCTHTSRRLVSLRCCAALLAGQVGFTALIVPTTPASTSPEDVYAAQALTEFHSGQILDPVVFGDYSDTYKQLVPAGQLNTFSDDEKALLRGEEDFVVWLPRASRVLVLPFVYSKYSEKKAFLNAFCFLFRP